jgi:hypothetical protein
MLPSPAPQKFTTFTTFAMFAIFAKFAKFANFDHFRKSRAWNLVRPHARSVVACTFSMLRLRRMARRDWTPRRGARWVGRLGRGLLP